MDSIAQTPRLCVRCGNPIPPARAYGPQAKSVKYCSVACTRPPRVGAPVASATTGAISEYIVVVDLLRRGYNVFRAASPACSCDLVVLLSTGIKRIEVRTAYTSVSTGVLTAPIGQHDHGRFDILALVYHGTRIAYYPQLPDDNSEHPPLSPGLRATLVATGVII